IAACHPLAPARSQTQPNSGLPSSAYALNAAFSLRRDAIAGPRPVFFWPRFWKSILIAIPAAEPLLSKRVSKEGHTKDDMSGMAQLLRGYRLSTPKILYRRPDHPRLLQSYVWQEYDLAPRFPVLNKFLHFWESQLDGKLHSVWIAATGIIHPAELKY